MGIIQGARGNSVAHFRTWQRSSLLLGGGSPQERSRRRANAVDRSTLPLNNIQAESNEAWRHLWIQRCKKP